MILSDKANDLREQTLKAMADLREAVRKLEELYTEHEELNDIQPVGTSDVFAASLDEWYSSLLDNRHKWEAVPAEKWEKAIEREKAIGNYSDE